VDVYGSAPPLPRRRRGRPQAQWRARLRRGAVWARRIVLTGGLAVGSVSEAFTFNMPAPSGVSGSNVATTSAMSVTLLGVCVAEADYNGQARVEGSHGKAMPCTAESSVVCKTASGTTWARHSATTRSWASLSSVLPGASNGATTGATSVTLLGGGGVGPADYSSRSGVGGGVHETTAWTSSSAVACKTAAGSVWARASVMTGVVSVGSVSAVFTLDGPAPSSVLASNAASTAAPSVTLLGGRVGDVAYSGRAGVGSSDGETTAWASERSVACKTAVGTVWVRRSVMTGGLAVGSVSEVFTFDGPVPSSLDVSNAALGR